MEPLRIETALQINRSPDKVFEAIVDPEKMTHYFISRGSARLKEGTTVTWQFPEFPDEFPVKVDSVTPGENIQFRWEGPEGKLLRVEIRLSPVGNSATLVRVSEGEMPVTDAGIKWYGQNTGGWANFLACLKAYMEYDINLRKGGFDFMRK